MNRCEICGCTDWLGCPPDGCGWSQLFALLGRLICTHCEGLFLWEAP